MKKWGLVLALVFAVVVGLYLFFNPAKNAAPPAGETPSNSLAAAQNNAAIETPTAPASQTESSTASTLQPDIAARAGMAALPPTGTAEKIPPAIVLENISHAIRQYGAMFGGNPVGTNPEITAALNGNNPKQINFIKPEAGMRINGNGELVDAWGTPLFFHQLSGSETEIHSAGPDKIMWTADDLVAR
jgi:hypothetical protein